MGFNRKGKKVRSIGIIVRPFFSEPAPRYNKYRYNITAKHLQFLLSLRCVVCAKSSRKFIPNDSLGRQTKNAVFSKWNK